MLAHAKQLFVKFGYQNTTTEKIARAAQVSEPVLYRHFESKRALFLEAFVQPGFDRRTATEDVLWTLLNTKEFLYNH